MDPRSETAPSAPVEFKRALTIEEFVAAYATSRSVAYEEIQAGRLTALKHGRRTLIPVSAADAWLASLPRVSKGEAA